MSERSRNIEELREKVKELEEQVFKKDAFVQQCNNELKEKNQIIKDKNIALEEKSRALEELTVISEKRKQQIDQLRLSVKARDDALAEFNNKHRTLLSQYENGCAERTPPNSPITLHKCNRSLSPKPGQQSSSFQQVTKIANDFVYSDAKKERNNWLDSATVQDLLKEVEAKEAALKREEEAKKQLVLKLCNVQRNAETIEQKLQKLGGEHEKAIKTIQGFMERQHQIEDKYLKKEKRVIDLEHELNRLKRHECSKEENHGYAFFTEKHLSSDIIEDPQCEHSKQQRLKETEIKINDLHKQMEIIKAEKILLEKQIQVKSEVLQEKILHNKGSVMNCLELKEQSTKEGLFDEVKAQTPGVANTNVNLDIIEREELLNELTEKNIEIADKNKKIEQLNKELCVKTQNLQKLVNTELWSKNKEIAKLHNHITTVAHSHDKTHDKTDIMQHNTGTQLQTLIKELLNIGINVTFVNGIVQLHYTNCNELVDIKAVANHVQKLITQECDLEKEVDYLKWLKLVAKPDIASEIDGYGNETERAKKYCELLRTHLMELVKFMKGMIKDDDQTNSISNQYTRIVLDVLVNSKILSDDFVHSVEGMSIRGISPYTKIEHCEDRKNDPVRKCRSENLVLDLAKNKHTCTQSDSETFSEPDRAVSKARIGLQPTQRKFLGRSKSCKNTKTLSDSEDSIDYVPYHKNHQADVNDFSPNHIQELKETNNLLYSGLNALRNDLAIKITCDGIFDEKVTSLIMMLEKSRKLSERLRSVLEKRTHEYHVLRRETKQHNIRKLQLEKKIIDVENKATEIAKPKTEIIQCKENTESKTTETFIKLNKENEMLRINIKKMENESETAKENIAKLTKELDHLTLMHSQILVENTKLTNEKLTLEQEVRKIENRYDITVRSVHDKFDKKILDLNQINDSYRARMQELEDTNKELRGHVSVCDTTDSAPSSSGASSIPAGAIAKQTCEDINQEYQSYNSSQYWLPISYPTFGMRSKSSCSPDLGIESDAAVTVSRPLQDTLKITESMTNLLNDDDNGNREMHIVVGEGVISAEGLDEVESLKQENETLKRKLVKTRRALEDTFQHLSTSNKNKKNVEKAIAKQLLMTKSILKKTRVYEDTIDN